MERLKGQMVWVTGAGSGVGRSTALLLAARGARVALLGRRRETVAQVLDEVLEAGGEGVAEQLDVGERDQVRAVSKSLLEHWGGVAVLVNAAGLNVPVRSFTEVSGEDFDRMVRTNLVGAFNMIQAVLGPMRAAEGGTIINVASTAGKQAYRMAGPGYCSSKFGMVGLSHTVNAEERWNGIRCTALCPGEINTPFLDSRPVAPTEEERSALMAPEDVAEVIAFLAELNPRCTVPELLMVPTIPFRRAPAKPT